MSNADTIKMIREHLDSMVEYLGELRALPEFGNVLEADGFYLNRSDVDGELYGGGLVRAIRVDLDNMDAAPVVSNRKGTPFLLRNMGDAKRLSIAGVETAIASLETALDRLNG